MNKLLAYMLLGGIGFGMAVSLTGCNSAPVQEGTAPAPPPGVKGSASAGANVDRK